MHAIKKDNVPVGWYVPPLANLRDFPLFVVDLYDLDYDWLRNAAQNGVDLSTDFV